MLCDSCWHTASKTSSILEEREESKVTLLELTLNFFLCFFLMDSLMWNGPSVQGFLCDKFFAYEYEKKRRTNILNFRVEGSLNGQYTVFTNPY